MNTGHTFDPTFWTLWATTPQQWLIRAVILFGIAAAVMAVVFAALDDTPTIEIRFASGDRHREIPVANDRRSEDWSGMFPQSVLVNGVEVAPGDSFWLGNERCRWYRCDLTVELVHNGHQWGFIGPQDDGATLYVGDADVRVFAELVETERATA